ncbi:MAG: AAA family ATPase, partial [Deltaproteobacteria bacterium]|nr:AAA family ATPase [Deltaproteobacteria bacterium]
GFTGSDIAALCREAAMATLRRILPNINLEDKSISKEILEKLTVTPEDFEQALKEVQPSALREIMVEVPKVKWADVGGLEEVKTKLKEIVELPLTNPDAFYRLGIKAPKGLLLYGPPGTGKTLIAKAVATEANANFLTAKGSDILSKWYGESEKRIGEYFKRARQVSPSILFFDELDSLASTRGSGPGEPRATERVVNQILAEMDGLDEIHGVVVIGATNRPDWIDPALLRPGRFDEIVYVPIPDQKARLEIFRTHTKKMALDPDVDINKLAEITPRFSGADIAAVCTKAGLLERDYEKIARTVKQDSMKIGFR